SFKSLLSFSSIPLPSILKVCFLLPEFVTLKVVSPAGRLVGMSILYSLRVTLTVLSAAFTAETLRLAANNRIGAITPKILREQNVMTFSFQMAQMPFSYLCIYAGVLTSWRVSKTRQRGASKKFVVAGRTALRGFLQSTVDDLQDTVPLGQGKTLGGRE